MRSRSDKPRIPMTQAQIVAVLHKYPQLAETILKTLPEREAYVIGRSYGIGIERRTLEQIGEELGGISRSRVSQIRHKALRLICHESRKDIINEYLISLIMGDDQKQLKVASNQGG
jgi:DNA-directed RNA polymerase sigma subunit (sigma70/sigma32)